MKVLTMAVMRTRPWWWSHENGFLLVYTAGGVLTADHLKLLTIKLSLDLHSIPDDYVAVELLWVSVDPYLRGRMSGQEEGLYFSQFAFDEVHIL